MSQKIHRMCILWLMDFNAPTVSLWVSSSVDVCYLNPKYSGTCLIFLYSGNALYFLYQCQWLETEEELNLLKLK
jgi:hypothetical protein